MSDLVHVKGLAELEKYLDQVPVKMQKNVMRGALRAGMEPVAEAAKTNIHSVSGQLAAGLKIRTRAKGSVVMARLVAEGKHYFVAKWVEFGTAAHNIAAKAGGALSFAGIFAAAVWHPGARPHPFLRPALDGNATAAVVAAAEYIKKRLATKAGLDTSAVLIEGDE